MLFEYSFIRDPNEHPSASSSDLPNQDGTEESTPIAATPSTVADTGGLYVLAPSLEYLYLETRSRSTSPERCSLSESK
jgi:hypothetical protein